MFPRTTPTPAALKIALTYLQDVREGSTQIEKSLALGVRPVELKGDMLALIQLLDRSLEAMRRLIPNTADGLFTFQPKLKEAREACANLSVSMALGLNLDRAFKRFNLALAEVKWVLDLLDIAASENSGLDVGQPTTAATRTREATSRPAESANIPGTRPKVFVVHGHDVGAEQDVARTLEKLGCEPVILHEQENLSRTVIEKLEEHSDVQYAVVLLTPDDIGAEADAPDELRPRARQNVVLELGYFIGKYGRAKVCTLYKAGVELPSDWTGVVYLPMDPAGAWRLLLAKELRAVGIDADANRL